MFGSPLPLPCVVHTRAAAEEEPDADAVSGLDALIAAVRKRGREEAWGAEEGATHTGRGEAVIEASDVREARPRCRMRPGGGCAGARGGASAIAVDPASARAAAAAAGDGFVAAGASGGGCTNAVSSALVAAQLALHARADARAPAAAGIWTSRVPRWRHVLADVLRDAGVADPLASAAACWVTDCASRLYELTHGTTGALRCRGTASGFIVSLLGLKGVAPRSLRCATGGTLHCSNPLHYADGDGGPCFNPFTDDAALAAAASTAGALTSAAAASAAAHGAAVAACSPLVVHEAAAWDARVPRWRHVLAEMISLLPPGTGVDDCWTDLAVSNSKRFELTSPPAPRQRATGTGVLIKLLGLGVHPRVIRCRARGTARCANPGHYGFTGLNTVASVQPRAGAPVLVASAVPAAPAPDVGASAPVVTRGAVAPPKGAVAGSGAAGDPMASAPAAGDDAVAPAEGPPYTRD
jgi:hypothetical protein